MCQVDACIGALQQRSITKLTELTLRGFGGAPGDVVCAVQENEEKSVAQSSLESISALPLLADDLKQILRRLQSKNRLGLHCISQDEKSRSDQYQLDVRTVEPFEKGNALFAFGVEDFRKTPHDAVRHRTALPISVEP
jgi:hypothetical protein